PRFARRASCPTCRSSGMEKPKIPHGIASRSTKTLSFNDIDRWVCPVQVFSITSHDQNASLAKQGLSAASPHPIALCRQDCCVPGSRWSASSLRTSRRLSYCGDRTGGPISAWGEGTPHRLSRGFFGREGGVESGLGF